MRYAEVAVMRASGRASVKINVWRRRRECGLRGNFFPVTKCFLSRLRGNSCTHRSRAVRKPRLKVLASSDEISITPWLCHQTMRMLLAWGLRATNVDPIGLEELKKIKALADLPWCLVLLLFVIARPLHFERGRRRRKWEYELWERPPSVRPFPPI